MKPLKPKDKIIIALLSAIMSLMVVDALRTTITVSRSAGDGLLIGATYRVWVWEIKE